VCKYVRKPGEAEVLKPGKQPISVSVNAIPNPPGPNVQIGDQFADAQERSIVVGFDNGGPPPDISGLCPGTTGTTTTPPSTGGTTTTCPDCTPDTQVGGTTTTTVAGSTTTVPGGTTTLPGSTTTAPSTTTTAPGLPPGGTSTTPLVAPVVFSIGSASTVCVRDAPFVELTFGNQPELNGTVGTLEFRTLDGDVIESHQIVYQANTSFRVVYPGAEVDPVTGEALDWPGWMLNDDGFWVLDPSDAEFRDGLHIVATLPVTGGEAGLPAGFGESRPLFQQATDVLTSEADIAYPPETAACNSPEGPFTPGEAVPVPPNRGGSIPATGTDALPLVFGGLLVVSGGAGLIWLTRRRGLRRV